MSSRLPRNQHVQQEHSMSVSFVGKSILSLMVGSAAALLSHSQAASAEELAVTASVYMYSQPGNWVGGALGAQQVDWVHGIDGIFTASANYGSNLEGINISYNDGDLWNFQFAAPSYVASTNTNSGQLLTDGLYTHAQRFPFNSPTRPGLTISGNGRGENQDSGWFDVLNIAYNPDGTLASLAVDFAQYGGTSGTGPELYGSLRFNSDIPVDPVPLPDSAWLLLSGALSAMLLINRRGSLPKPGWRSSTN
jgi:hypothetical protein